MRGATACLIALVGSLWACERSGAPKEEGDVREVEVAPLADKKPSATVKEPEPSRHLEIAHPVPPEHSLVLAWSQSLKARDYEKVSHIYGERVLFHGKSLTGSEVVELKRQALEKDAEYRQALSAVRVEKGPSGFTSRFEKTWEEGAKYLSAKLVFVTKGKSSVLVLETDETTDATLGVPIGSGCSDATIAAAGSHPEIRADRERVARDMPEAPPGGLVYEETATSMDGVVGYSLPERFDPRWWLAVEQGKISLRNVYTMEQLTLSAATLERVQAACSEKKP